VARLACVMVGFLETPISGRRGYDRDNQIQNKYDRDQRQRRDGNRKRPKKKELKQGQEDKETVAGVANETHWHTWVASGR